MRSNRRGGGAAGRALALGALLAGWLLAPAAAIAQSLERALESVVSVLPEWPPDARRREEPEASGVVLFDGRVVATALHAVEKALSARVRTADGRVLAARLGAGDRSTDIALLLLDEVLPPIAVADGEPRLGDPVCAVGNAFGLDLSVTCGVVSATNRAGVGFNAVEDFVQTDAAVNPGASGGALVTPDGRFVGLLSAIFTKRADANIGVNFAIAAPLVTRVAAALRDDGRIAWPSAGMRLAPALARTETGVLGARVVAVAPESVAARAGVEAGDVIVGVAGRRARGPADVVGALARAVPPAIVELTVLRAGQELALTLNL